MVHVLQCPGFDGKKAEGEAMRIDSERVKQRGDISGDNLGRN